MSYVQAAVYDAAMKISHRYMLYHHFRAAAGKCLVGSSRDHGVLQDARLLPRRSENRASTLTTSRTYVSVEDLDMELVNARVWIGFHHRNSVRAGENLGTNVYTRDDEGD